MSRPKDLIDEELVEKVKAELAPRGDGRICVCL